MRTTLAIHDAVLERAKARALQRGLTLGDYVTDALRRDLLTPVAQSTPVALPTVKGGGVRPGIDLTSNQSIYDALDEEFLR